ncbi:hypothetical protein FKX85_04730 [Echinicola soli]|uniref:Lipoprotein n=1 Tax=Echinicola soli TaxID=2591634 RepID=A0A514CEX1_9BACT|nr:hypothetical protein [Echinicola soli]QDH78381.1 hypothetical protein FKX85_04730 [Echinicola soli]
MKKLSYLLFACFLVLSLSCKEEEEPVIMSCGVENPTEELEWMQELIAEIESTEMGRHYTTIQSGYYEGDFYYFDSSCCPNCFYVPTIFNCQGESQEDLDISISEMTDIELVWKSEENQCNFEE